MFAVRPGMPALLRRHPEWWAAALSAAAWLAVVPLHPANAPGHPAGHLATAGPARALVGWTLMAVAMMVPVTLPAVRHVALNSTRHRRARAMGVYLAAFVGLWVALGVGIVASERALLGAEEQVGRPLALAAALTFAAAWQVSRAKRRALNACHRTVPLRIRGWRADAACVRFGLLQSWRCVRSCWALMAVMVIAGHGGLWWTLPLMAGLTALVLAEEGARHGRWLLQPSAALLATVAIAVLVSSWLGVPT